MLLVVHEQDGKCSGLCHEDLRPPFPWR
jgi:hypothetical protein